MERRLHNNIWMLGPIEEKNVHGFYLDSFKLVLFVVTVTKNIYMFYKLA